MKIRERASPMVAPRPILDFEYGSVVKVVTDTSVGTSWVGVYFVIGDDHLTRLENGDTHSYHDDIWECITAVPVSLEISNEV